MGSAGSLESIGVHWSPSGVQGVWSPGGLEFRGFGVQVVGIPGGLESRGSRVQGSSPGDLRSDQRKKSR